MAGHSAYWSGQRGDFSHAQAHEDTWSPDAQAHEDTWSPDEWSDWAAHTKIGEFESRMNGELNMANQKIDSLQAKVTEQEEMIASIRTDLEKSYEAYKELHGKVTELQAAHTQLEENTKAIHRVLAEQFPQGPPGPPPGQPPLTGSRTPPPMPSTPGSRIPSRATTPIPAAQAIPSRSGTPQPVECPIAGPSPTRPTEVISRELVPDAGDTPMCTICPTYDAARSDACVEGKVHTKCFDGYARDEDISAGEPRKAVPLRLQRTPR
jgi:hypothetical protein